MTHRNRAKRRPRLTAAAEARIARWAATNPHRDDRWLARAADQIYYGSRKGEEPTPSEVARRLGVTATDLWRAQQGDRRTNPPVRLQKRGSEGLFEDDHGGSRLRGRRAGTRYSLASGDKRGPYFKRGMSGMHFGADLYGRSFARANPSAKWSREKRKAVRRGFKKMAPPHHYTAGWARLGTWGPAPLNVSRWPFGTKSPTPAMIAKHLKYRRDPTTRGVFWDWYDRKSGIPAAMGPRPGQRVVSGDGGASWQNPKLRGWKRRMRRTFGGAIPRARSDAYRDWIAWRVALAEASGKRQRREHSRLPHYYGYPRRGRRKPFPSRQERKSLGPGRSKKSAKRKNPWGTFLGGMAAGAGMHVATRALNAIHQNGKKRRKGRR